MAKSIIQKNKQCYMCFTDKNLEKHHIFGGSNRRLSEKYGLTVYLCKKHHTGAHGVHFDGEMMNFLHLLGQARFEEKYPDSSFFELFGKDYIQLARAKGSKI